MTNFSAVLLTIVFVILKVTDKIDWSWVWVLAPMWIGLAIFVCIFVFALILAVISKR